MQDFQLYFNHGWHHILDLRAYSHILYLLALYSIYNISDLKKISLLFILFTLGYSITLITGIWNNIPLGNNQVEFLVSLTALSTTFFNIINKRKRSKKMLSRYLMAVIFGLIHGLAFLAYFKSLALKSHYLLPDLLGFSSGLGFGQLIIIAGSLLLSFILIWIIKIKQWDWNFFLSSAVFGIALIMALQNLQALL